jgi:hypothetical protein
LRSIPGSTVIATILFDSVIFGAKIKDIFIIASNMTTFVGLDPGVSGAIAIIRPDGIEIHDCPNLPKNGQWSRHDSKAMFDILKTIKGEIFAVIEHVRFDSRDELHKKSAEVLVRSHEAWLTVLEILGIPYLDLEVPLWRKAAGCSGLTNPADIVRYALTLYPCQRKILKRESTRAKAGFVYYDGRGEALLLAHAAKILYEKENVA